MNENWTKFIELYLQGELSPEDTAKLKAELERNPDMRASLEQQKRVHEIAKRNGERQMVRGIRKQYQFQRTIKTSIISVVVAVVIATAAYFIVNHFANRTSENSDMDSGQAAEIGIYDRFDDQSELVNLPIHYFEHDGNDATFLSPKGILLSVPTKTFVLDGKTYNGKAIIQFQEAIDASDIVKAGLSTMSGDRLLETQGMFGLKAFTPDGRELKVNDKDGIYLQVPVDENKAGMQLFQGVKNAKGDIDWQNPKPIEKLPVQANMLDLDLFPPGFEPMLDQLKWHKKKEQRDSLYLSFEEIKAIPDTNKVKNVPIVAVRTGQTERIKYHSIHNTKKFEVRLENNKSYILSKGSVPSNISFTWTNLGFLGVTPSVNLSEMNEEGKYELTVGYLQDSDINDDPRKISYDFNSIISKSINTGVDHFEFTTNMEGAYIDHLNTFKMVNDRVPFYEATYILTYPKSYKNPIEIVSRKVSDLIFAGRNKSMRINVKRTKNTTSEAAMAASATATKHLPPLKVLAIWKKDFNGTILATRDFEKRMAAIHKACNEKVFDVYANQLNKPLWQLDEQVVKMGYPNFKEFADERVGALKLDNAHMNILRQFYQSNISKLSEKAKKDKNFQKAIEMAWDANVRKERKNEKKRTDERIVEAFNQEYDLNLKNVMKQLGKTVGVSIYGGGTVYNIDKYVRDATIARKSSVISDPDTGKTAQITYKEMSAKIKDAGSYGRLFLYLFPKELNSFQRIDPVNGEFRYALNGDIRYEILFVGINDEGYFIADEGKVSEGDLGEIKLKSVSEKEFERRVEKLNEKRNSKPMSITSELSWLKTEKQNYKVQADRKKMLEFRNTMRGIVFPCSSIDSEYYFYQEPKKGDEQNPFL